MLQNKALLYQNVINSYNFVDTAFFIGGGKIDCSNDFNLDGLPDLALSIASWIHNPSEDSIYIYTNNQNWGFDLTSKHYIGDWFNPLLISGDLNMDGYPELVSLVSYFKTLHFHVVKNYIMLVLTGIIFMPNFVKYTL